MLCHVPPVTSNVLYFVRPTRTCGMHCSTAKSCCRSLLQWSSSHCRPETYSISVGHACIFWQSRNIYIIGHCSSCQSSHSLTSLQFMASRSRHSCGRLALCSGHHPISSTCFRLVTACRVMLGRCWSVPNSSVSVILRDPRQAQKLLHDSLHPWLAPHHCELYIPKCDVA